MSQLPQIPQFSFGAVSGAGHPFKKHQGSASRETASVNSSGRAQPRAWVSDTQTGAPMEAKAGGVCLKDVVWGIAWVRMDCDRSILQLET